MSRLAVRVTLTVVGVVVLTLVLIILVQFYGIQREQRQLPAELRGGRSLVFVLPPVRWPRAAEAGPRFRNLDISNVGTRQLGLFIQDIQSNRARSLLLSGTLAVVLAVALGLILSRMITRPIQRVSLAAARLAEGDLSVRVPVAPHLAEARDETAELARSFNAMADTLEKLEHERRAMIADIAHELRTPLTIMRGRLEALEDGLAPLSLEEVANLHQQTLLLARLVDDLRLLSLAEHGRLPFERRPADLSALVRRVAGDFEAQAQARAIRLSVSAPAALEAQVDADRLAQVLANLLDNALRHTPSAGTVEVSAMEEAGEVILSVCDSGPGFPEDVRERLFERFYRVEASRERSSGGSGLGLAIVKTLVGLHGGRVTARNRAEGGAELRVVLPR